MRSFLRYGRKQSWGAWESGRPNIDHSKSSRIPVQWPFERTRRQSGQKTSMPPLNSILALVSADGAKSSIEFMLRYLAIQMPDANGIDRVSGQQIAAHRHRHSFDKGERGLAPATGGDGDADTSSLVALAEHVPSRGYVFRITPPWCWINGQARPIGARFARHVGFALRLRSQDRRSSSSGLNEHAQAIITPSHA